MNHLPGTRLCCHECGVSLIVVKTGNMQLECCDREMKIAIKKPREGQEVKEDKK